MWENPINTASFDVKCEYCSKMFGRNLLCVLVQFVHVSIVDFEGISREVHQDLDYSAALLVCWPSMNDEIHWHSSMMIFDKWLTHK